MTETSLAHFRRHRFPAEIIAHAVWLYFRVPLSLRDVEGLLAERGIMLEIGVTNSSTPSMERESGNIFRLPSGPDGEPGRDITEVCEVACLSVRHGHC
jgi:hypothetical protein